MRKRFARAAINADRHLTFEGFSLDLANERLVCDGEVVAGEIALQAGQLAEAEALLREALAAIEGCESPLVEWRVAAGVARLYERQRRRRMAETARARSAAVITRLVDSSSAGHDLRQSFLGAPAVREVLGLRGAVRERGRA